MADTTHRTDPFSGGATHASTIERNLGMEDRPAEDYQAEIETLRSELSKLADAVGGSVKDTVQPLARELEATVARNPTVSVAVAAGVGLLLGLIITRK